MKRKLTVESHDTDACREIDAWMALQQCDLCKSAGPFSSCVHYSEFLKAVGGTAPSLAVGTVEQTKRERALWLADKLVGDYGSEAAQLLRYFAQSATLSSAERDELERLRSAPYLWARASAAAEDDAARYRWWRSQWSKNTDAGMEILNETLSTALTPVAIDAAIDAAIAKDERADSAPASATARSVELEEGFTYWTHEGHILRRCYTGSPHDAIEALGPGGWTEVP